MRVALHSSCFVVLLAWTETHVPWVTASADLGTVDCGMSCAMGGTLAGEGVLGLCAKYGLYVEHKRSKFALAADI
jgi:hypothetical protein